MSRAGHKNCEYCGKSFKRDVRNTWVYWEKARFCSRPCFGKHHAAIAKANRQPMETVFAKWFTRDAGCWLWNGALDKDGYGVFTYAMKQHRAAKIALLLDGRPVPEGLYACHHCDNPRCVRPDHLYVGTPTENMADAGKRGRIRVGERNRSSKLTTEDVKAIRQAGGTNEELAAIFGVCAANISQIKTRKTWKHVP